MGTSTLEMVVAPSNFIKPILIKKFEIPISVIVRNSKLTADNQTRKIHQALTIFKGFAEQKPDDIVQKALAKYQTHIKILALKVNKAISITPPTDFEKPIIKFLGLDYKDTKHIFQPISSTYNF